MVYDGRLGFHGFDLANSFGDYEIQQGVLIIQDEFISTELQVYLFDGEEFEVIPKNELISGNRRFHISCDLKVIRAIYNVDIFMWEVSQEEDSIDDRTITITDNEWIKTDFYFRIPPNKDYRIHIGAERISGDGSLQIRHLVVAERVG